MTNKRVKNITKHEKHLHKIWLYCHNRLGHKLNYKTGYCVQCKQNIGLNNLKQNLFGRIDTLTDGEA